MTKIYIAAIFMLILVAGTMDYQDQLNYEHISDDQYSQDYLDFVNENGIEIVLCDTDSDCEEKNPVKGGEK